LLLAKVALGVGGVFVLASAYSLHEGVIRISVDEHLGHGEHLHLLLPAALVPVALRLAPQNTIKDAARQAGPWLPIVRSIAKELRELPSAELLEVRGADERVRIRTEDRKLLLDVDSPRRTLHIACPLRTVERVSDEMMSRHPRS
jgi:hypothetical protein